MNAAAFRSFLRNYFRFENSYFTVGGWRKQLVYFLKMGSVSAHLVDRVKFRIFPKLDIVSGFPSHLDIESASACQMRCPMCYTTYMPDELKGVMKWDLYQSLVDQAAALGVYSIKLSWRGEPLLNKHIVDMVRYAKQRGIREVAFLTNAELLTASKAQALVDAGLDWLSVSADGVGDVYNRIRAPAIFEETVERVRYLKRYRDEKGLRRPLIRVQSIMSAVESNPDEFYAAWSEVVDRMNVIADEVRDFDDKQLAFDPYFVCAKPWQRLTIAYDGKVHQCISDYAGKKILGDAATQPLREIWHAEAASAVREAFRRHRYLDDNPACRYCSYGVVTEKSRLRVKDTIAVRRYRGIQDVVVDDRITRTPPDPSALRRKKRGARLPEEGADG